jgi:hypothetical protein
MVHNCVHSTAIIPNPKTSERKLKHLRAITYQQLCEELCLFFILYPSVLFLLCATCKKKKKSHESTEMFLMVKVVCFNPKLSIN